MELQSEILSLDELSAIMVELGPGKAKQAISPCPECQKNSRVGFLKDYRISLDDSILFCDNDLCCYTVESLSDVQSIQPAEDSDLDDFLSSLCDIGSVSPSPSCDEIDAIFDLDSPSILSSTERASDSDSTNSNSLHCTSHSSKHSFESSNSFLPSSQLNTATHPEACEAIRSFSANSSIVSSTSQHNQPLRNCASSSRSHDVSSYTPGALSSTSDTTKSLVSSISSVITPELDLPAMDITPELPQLPKSFTPYAYIQSTESESQCRRYRYVMLWYNLDALCWLDVLLAVLCHNNSLRALLDSLPYSCVMKKLLLAFDESQGLIEPLQAGDRSLLHSVMENDALSVKRGGGYCMDSSSSLLDSISKSTILSGQEISSAKRKVHLAGIKLECAREEVWQFIEPLLKCERGKDDSPVFAFPLILRSDKTLEKLFLTEYSWSTRCTTCHHQQVDRKSGVMITFPKIQSFEVNKDMTHLRDCVKCLAPNQRRKLQIQRYSHNLVMHFADGLKEFDVDAMAFTCSRGDRYVVSSAIEYRTLPNHFVLWQRQLSQGQTGGNWMCYDDLRSQYAQFSHKKLSASPPDIHIVFWELVQPMNDMGHDSLQSPSCIETHSLLGGDNSMDTENQRQAASPTTDVSTFSEFVSPAASIQKDSSAPTPKLSNSDYSSSPQAFPTAGTRCEESVNSTGRSAAPKKTVPLLSAKIGSQRRTLTGSIRYGVAVPAATTSNVSQDSLTDVMTALSPLTGAVSNAAVTPQSKSKLPCLASTKSYLDIVQPLLQKHKQQKGTKMGGYVPKSKRKVEEKPTKTKKVQFSGSPYFNGPSIVAPNVPHVPPKVSLGVPVTNAPRTSTTGTYTIHKNASMILSDTTETGNRVSRRAAKRVKKESESMPLLEDMLKDFY